MRDCAQCVSLEQIPRPKPVRIIVRAIMRAMMMGMVSATAGWMIGEPFLEPINIGILVGGALLLPYIADFLIRAIPIRRHYFFTSQERVQHIHRVPPSLHSEDPVLCLPTISYLARPEFLQQCGWSVSDSGATLQLRDSKGRIIEFTDPFSTIEVARRFRSVDGILAERERLSNEEQRLNRELVDLVKQILFLCVQIIGENEPGRIRQHIQEFVSRLPIALVEESRKEIRDQGKGFISGIWKR